MVRPEDRCAQCGHEARDHARYSEGWCSWEGNGVFCKCLGFKERIKAGSNGK